MRASWSRGSPDDAIRQADGYRTLADVALLHGKVDTSTRYRRTAMRGEEEGGYLAHYLLDGRAPCALSARLHSTARSAVRRARRRVFRDRPSGTGVALARDFARNGLASGRFGEAARHHMLGNAALAGGHYADAVLELRQAAEGEQCSICALPELVQAYDRGGAGDSAVAVYERYLATPWIGRLELDAVQLPRVCERLGELYEARHEPQRAAAMYGRMVALWRDADPELRPRVAAAERRLAALAVER